LPAFSRYLARAHRPAAASISGPNGCQRSLTSRENSIDFTGAKPSGLGPDAGHQHVDFRILYSPPDGCLHDIAQ